ncbi:MAG: GlsB/YeaQ/YmgE family stress response membrane protein [Opitutales bacterium]|nr:GlsB/YeaQ/YmgE family stress response membrane protein [Opitutales bacterium]
MERRRQQLEVKLKGVAKVEPTGFAPAEALHRDYALKALRKELFRIHEKAHAFFGQGDLVFAAVKQAHAEFLFEILDLARERRLGQAQPFSSPREIQFLRDRHKIPQVTQLHKTQRLREFPRVVNALPRGWWSVRRRFALSPRLDRDAKKTRSEIPNLHRVPIIGLQASTLGKHRLPLTPIPACTNERAGLGSKKTSMTLEQLLIFLLIGAVAGWLAGLIIRGGGFGLIRNIIIGVLGALFGGWLFGVLDIPVDNEWVGSLITATAGAVILLFLLGFLRRR